MGKRMHTLGGACSIIGGLIGVLGWLLRFARLGGETPVLHEAPDISGPTKIVSTPVLGGLHRTYHRMAA